MIERASSLKRKATTSAMAAGEAHPARVDVGWSCRLPGVSMTDGRSAFARIPSSRYSTARLLTRAQTAAFAVMYADAPANGLNADRAETATIEPPPAPSRCGSSRLRDQVGRPQVQPQQLLEVVDGRLVQSATHREATDEVGHGDQRGVGVGSGGADHTGDSLGVEEVRLHELEPRMGGDPRQLGLHDPRDHDPPALMEQPFGDGTSQSARAAGHQCGSTHVACAFRLTW